MSKNKFLFIIDRLPEFVALFAAVAGVYTYVDDKFHSREVEKKKQSLNYIERYNSGDIGSDRKELVLLWSEQDRTYALSQLRNSQAVKDKFTKDVVKGNINGVGIVLSITNFLDQVAVCMETDVCDNEILHSYLDNDVVQHFRLYGSLLCEISENTRLVGLGSKAKLIFEVPSSDCKI